jgi:hypothetical protein
MGRATFDTMSEFGTFLPFVASQHHGRYRGYRGHVTDGAGRPSLDPERSSAKSQYRGAAGSCRTLWCAYHFGSGQAAPHPIQNNSVLPQGRRLGVLAQSNPSRSGGVRLEAAFKPRGADHVYTPEASDPL